MLRMVRGDSPGRVIVLSGERCILGRHPNCHIVLENPAVSRHHAQVLESHGNYFVEDLRSRNGTLLNGKPLEGRVQLSEGDQVRISEILFTFQTSIVPAVTDTVSSHNLHETESVRDDTPLTPEGIAITRVQNTVDEESGIFVLENRYQEPPFDSPEDPPVVGALDSRHSEDSRSDIKPQQKLRAVLEIARALGGELRLDTVLPKVLEQLFSSFPQAEQGFILLRDADSGRLRVMATKSRTMTEKGDAIVVSMTVVRAAMESGQALLSADVRKDDRFKRSSSLSKMRIRSIMCVPLLDHQSQSIGVIQIVTRNSDFEFTREDLDLLDAVASQAALAIENARLHEEMLEQRDLERDLDFATQVQLGFLPKSKPKLEQYKFADYYEAALRIGGDYFDYITLPDGRIAIAIGDVAGKGVPAALLMARLYSSTRYQLLTAPNPAAAVTGLNAEIASSGLGHRFITFLLMVLDPLKHEVAFVNAGHPAPLMRTKAGKITPIGKEASALPLGIMPDQTYQEFTCKIAAGSLLLAFTDGVTEAMSESQEVYGRERFLEFLKAAGQPIDEVVQGLIEDVEAFSGEGPIRDDTCVVAFQRLLS
ncbi:MAG: SpoIIE family protein phosphatase [Planctomycetaceae bacterium]